MTATPAPERAIAADDADILGRARAVIRLESAGLEALAAGLDGRFVGLVEMIEGVTGRVIVSGVGKSAHIARKAAATLASTGTPAQFVHGGDASHGDLGMITVADAVVLFSKSGETAELHDLANYCVRFGIPLGVITEKATSHLGRAATVTLALPAAAEACAITSAPTTSTAMMAAVGDALAVVLLNRRGFKAADFHILHPGGVLGGALLTVGEVMHAGDKVPLVSEAASVADAILEMSSKGFGCTGVVDGAGRLAGIITDGDLRRHFADGMLSATAATIMTRTPRITSGETLLSEALRLMTQTPPKVMAIFAVEAGKPIGIVHVHDCLRVGLV